MKMQKRQNLARQLRENLFIQAWRVESGSRVRSMLGADYECQLRLPWPGTLRPLQLDDRLSQVPSASLDSES